MEEITAQILSLYIGCDAKNTEGIGKIIGTERDMVKLDHRGYDNKGYTDDEGVEFAFVFLESDDHAKDTKPFLRSPSTMTHEEAKMLDDLEADMEDDGHLCKAEINASVTLQLLKWQFDLFGLIENDLAIEKVLTSNPH